MDKKKLDTFKKRLDEKQQELRKKVATMQQDGRAADNADTAQDIADRAANSYNKEFLFHQSTSDRQLLNMVEGALNRMREGVFGQCINCGEEINGKRLEAVPWTRYCIACQEKIEQGQMAQ